ncbi:MAG: ATP-binding protein [Coxiellaceae bacterium]|nr:ATP-binding protein [Coxiellaceae bacterium]
MKNNKFLGRELELTRLKALLDKRSGSFIAIKGRRRIGKSRLIEEYSHSFKHYYKFEGLAPDENTTELNQINEFCTQFSRQFNAPKPSYKDWSDALWAVGERVQSGKVLLFFDELSWMGSKSTTFMSKIKVFWDNLLQKNSELIFVVCSSASSWIEKNLLSSTAFVGRISFTLTLKELPLEECVKFWPSNISAFEKFKILSVTGGIPKYLEEINTKHSAEANIKQLCFTEGGLLVNEFNRIFSDLFMRNSHFYEKIVNLLATSPKDQSEIQQIIYKEADQQQYGRISEYLWELEESGYITRDYTWNLATGRDSRLSKYRLSDNYLRFYLKYIKHNLTKIGRGSFNLKSLINLPEWNAAMGFQFENLVLSNRTTIQQLLQIKPDEIVNDNPFFQNKTNRTAGCQIDYLIQTKYNSLYICEIKFSKQKIGTEVIPQVQQKIDRIKYPKGFSIRSVLIHVNGITSDLEDSDYFTEIIDVSDLLITN